MNCKQGDLAIVVQSLAGNEGKIVRCLEFVGTGRCDAGTILVAPNGRAHADLWRTDATIHTDTGSTTRLMSDSLLRPIRDNDGTDETLTWAGKLKAKPITVSTEHEAEAIADRVPNSHIIVAIYRNGKRIVLSEYYGRSETNRP